jgi:hypothetical protein
MYTWLIDLVLSSIPSWLWLVGAGSAIGIYLASGVLSHFPGISIYAKFLKPVSGIAALLCVFMYGGAGVQTIWEEKIRLAQAEADKKAAQAEQLNKDLERERKKKQEVITRQIEVVKEKIVVQKEVIDAKCEVAPEAVNILNEAARNPLGVKK